jgi:sulfate transport system permease protein
MKRHSILPGFGLTLGLTISYLSLAVLLPLSTLFFKATTSGGGKLWAAISDPRALAAYRLSFGAALGSALVNVVFGMLVVWVLARYRFPGKRLVDGLVDLPFALPTAVAGICLTAVYAPNGWIGQHLEKHGIKVAYSELGVLVAMVFVGLPFVIRTVQPVLQDLDLEVEEASASLGASRWQTFARVVFPSLVPAVLTGFALAFARAVGEYGSIVFISGNMPGKTEIAPLLIMTKLEQYDYTGATAIAVVMLLLSFGVLLFVNLVQWWGARHGRAVA